MSDKPEKLIVTEESLENYFMKLKAETKQENNFKLEFVIDSKSKLPDVKAKAKELNITLYKNVNGKQQYKKKEELIEEINKCVK